MTQCDEFHAIFYIRKTEFSERELLMLKVESQTLNLEHRPTHGKTGVWFSSTETKALHTGYTGFKIWLTQRRKAAKKSMGLGLREEIRAFLAEFAEF